MKLLEKQLNRDFDKWKHLGNYIVGLKKADEQKRTVDIYVLEITRYNDRHEPIATNKNPRIFKNMTVNTWSDVELVAFGAPTSPDFGKVIS